VVFCGVRIDADRLPAMPPEGRDERPVAGSDVEDRPGVLADLARMIARSGVDLDLVYVATRNRVVFGASDLTGLRAALRGAGSSGDPAAA